MKTIIIIPTFNEILNINSLVRQILKIAPNVSVLIVDDNSTDGTKNAINNLTKEFENKVFSLFREKKSGLASAYTDGFKFAIEKGFDSFVQMDADFSHNPKYLPQMLQLLEKNDVVIGSRNIKDGKVFGWSALRTIISKGGSIYSRLILGCSIKDLTGGFNAWTLNALNKININSIISKGYSFQIEMKYKAYKNNLNIVEFPIIFEDRKKGQSKMSKEIFLEALINVVKIRFMKLR